jgi:hypothetical protein
MESNLLLEFQQQDAYNMQPYIKERKLYVQAHNGWTFISGDSSNTKFVILDLSNHNPNQLISSSSLEIKDYPLIKDDIVIIYQLEYTIHIPLPNNFENKKIILGWAI